VKRPMGDVQTRELAQREFERPVVVVAGAGTGKTTLLVARVIAWCTGPGWRRHASRLESPDAVARAVMEGVVAITFTEKAAAEMAERIAGSLVKLAAGTVPLGWSPADADDDDTESVPERASALVDEAHRLRVQTIHAFCQGLLRERPFEAGIHPAFMVDGDGGRVEDLARTVVEETIRRLGSDPPVAWKTLASVAVGPRELAEVLGKLVGAGIDPKLLEADPFPEDAAVELARALGSAIDEFRRVAEPPLQGVGGLTAGLLTEVADISGGLEQLSGLPTWVRLAELAKTLGTKSAKRLDAWTEDGFNVRERKAVASCAAEVQAAAARLVVAVEPLTGVSVLELRAAFEVLAPMLAEVRGRMRRAGVLTFSDLLTIARRLLTGSERLCAEIREGVDQLMVDEFQDTDDVQCSIVERLSLVGDHRPGLFIVGDPKQSIYGWRNADLEASEEFVRRVQAEGGTVGHLDRNYRSAEAVLDEVERVVAPVMTFEPGVQPAFQPLVATGERVGSVGFARPPFSAVEYWVPRPLAEAHGHSHGRQPTTTLASGIEATSLARDIYRIHHREEVPWGEIAVLLRSVTEQETILDRFRELDIPYEVARERAYFRQREVVEMAALVRVILEPADQLALLTVLRSDAVGVPDAALAPLWDNDLPVRVAGLQGTSDDELDDALKAVERAENELREADAMPDDLPRWRAMLSAVLQAIARLRRSYREDPPDLFVERIRSLWFGEVMAAARYLGRFRLARLERFFHHLEEALTAPASAPSDISRALRRAVREGGESQTPPEPDTTRDAVHVMTIHAAKGLDFEHVYLAQTHRREGGGFGNDPLVVLCGEHGPEIKLLRWPTPGFSSAQRAAKEREAAERVRLLYVAATRARSRLVISGVGVDKKSMKPTARAVNLGGLLKARCDSRLIETQVIASEVRRVESETGVQWVLLDAGAMDLPTARSLAPISHQLSTAAGDAPHPTGYSQLRVLDVLSSTPPRSSNRKPSCSQHLASLATKPGEICGLETAAMPDDLAQTVAADLEVLCRHRNQAARHMDRPLGARISDAVHDPGQPDGAGVTPDRGDDTFRDTGRELARVVGTRVHQILERLDLTLPLAPQIPAMVEGAVNGLERTLPDGHLQDAQHRLTSIVDGMVQGDCLRRLEDIASHVVARELAVLVPPVPDDEAVGFVSGSIDLVYCDPKDGELVIADYKTDRVDGDEAVEARAAAYAPQVSAYARATAAALGLSSTPRCELWFLQADRIVVV